MSQGESKETMLPGDEGMLRRIAERVRALGLAVPVIAFLEMHRPLRGVAHAGALVLEPSLRFVMGEARVSPFLRILERPESLDRLLQLLEDPTTDQSTKESPVPSAGAQHGRV